MDSEDTILSEADPLSSSHSFFSTQETEFDAASVVSGHSLESQSSISDGAIIVQRKFSKGRQEHMFPDSPTNTTNINFCEYDISTIMTFGEEVFAHFLELCKCRQSPGNNKMELRGRRNQLNDLLDRLSDLLDRDSETLQNNQEINDVREKWGNALIAITAFEVSREKDTTKLQVIFESAHQFQVKVQADLVPHSECKVVQSETEVVHSETEVVHSEKELVHSEKEATVLEPQHCLDLDILPAPESDEVSASRRLLSGKKTASIDCEIVNRSYYESSSKRQKR
ncbi:uncharacterized protein LOC142351469 [Convolutriloba macropyga]|uniref:uncharacterized protein LOC142351469 n=1 Tax=Convolutriloba macropyga TaxID=536237 RepID=UPI003F524BD1